jgi:hypothetical protein
MLEAGEVMDHARSMVPDWQNNSWDDLCGLLKFFEAAKH